MGDGTHMKARPDIYHRAMDPRHEPYVTDPSHLEQLAGTKFVLLRPTQRLATAFLRAQSALRALPLGTRLSFPAPHLTLKGYGAEADELLMRVVRGWAEQVSPPSVSLERIDAFPDFRVLIARVERHESLVTAMSKIREASVGLTSAPGGEIPIEDWTFHMSLAYADRIEEAEWIELQKTAEAIRLTEASDVLEWVDLVAFDGGPERLLTSAKLGSR